MGMGCGLPLPFVWIFGNVYPYLRNWLTPIIGTRDLIGTDTEEISGSDKTDLYALLRWKF